MRALLLLALVACGSEESPTDIVDCEWGVGNPQCERACAELPGNGGPGDCTTRRSDGNLVVCGADVTTFSEGVRGCCLLDPDEPVIRFSVCE